MELYALEIDDKGHHLGVQAPNEVMGRLAEWERIYNEIPATQRDRQDAVPEAAGGGRRADKFDARYNPKS